VFSRSGGYFNLHISRMLVALYISSKEKDTFDLSGWWKSNCETLPPFTYVLRAVLTNSCPPEILFSIFNATYNDDQKKSHADYIELSIQAQFNKRAL